MDLKKVVRRSQYCVHTLSYIKLRDIFSLLVDVPSDVFLPVEKNGFGIFRPFPGTVTPVKKLDLTSRVLGFRPAPGRAPPRPDFELPDMSIS